MKVDPPPPAPLQSAFRDFFGCVKKTGIFGPKTLFWALFTFACGLTIKYPFLWLPWDDEANENTFDDDGDNDNDFEHYDHLNRVCNAKSRRLKTNAWTSHKIRFGGSSDFHLGW